MQAAGLASFEKRTAAKSGLYAFENEATGFAENFEKLFKANE